MKKIMILGAGVLQLPAIEKAKEMGLQVVAVDMNPQAIGFSVAGVIREVISTIDIPAVVEAAKRHRVDGVMTLASDMPMRTVAAVAKELHLVSIDADTALRATNKAAMRKALEESGVPIPHYRRVTDPDGFEKAVQELSGALVVKPADNSGSRGVVKLAADADAETRRAAYEYSLSSSRNGDVVVEEYMEGPEVSVETLSIDGVCHVIQITDKCTTGAPNFVETGHSQPTRLPPETAEAIRQVAIAANRAIGITNGPSHTEIIVTDQGPKVVELGARLGGDCITTHLVPMSTGVNIVECCIRVALGEKPDIVPLYNKGSAIRYFNQHAGRLVAIQGVDAAYSIPGVRLVRVVHEVGANITDVVDSSSRVGFVIVQEENAEAAIQVAERARDSVHLILENEAVSQ